MSPPSIELDEHFMRRALELADHAASLGEVPVGCVLVREGKILGEGSNVRESMQDPTGHAEMLAIRQASIRLGTFRLEGITAYVTLEPCAMCAGALVLSRVSRVVYGTEDLKAGAVESLYSIGVDGKLNHRFELSGGVLKDECKGRLSAFFAKLRAQGKG